MSPNYLGVISMAKRRKPKVTVSQTQFRWGVFIAGQLHSEWPDKPSAEFTAKDVRRYA